MVSLGRPDRDLARRRRLLRPGQRDKEVTIEQAAGASGSGGFPTSTWTTLSTVWASKIDLRGSERFQADQLSSRYDTRWEVPYQADMDPDLVDVPTTRRLIYQGRTHDIVSAFVIGRNEGIELTTVAATKVS